MIYTLVSPGPSSTVRGKGNWNENYPKFMNADPQDVVISLRCICTDNLIIIVFLHWVKLFGLIKCQSESSIHEYKLAVRQLVAMGYSKCYKGRKQNIDETGISVIKAFSLLAGWIKSSMFMIFKILWWQPIKALPKFWIILKNML